MLEITICCTIFIVLSLLMIRGLFRQVKAVELRDHLKTLSHDELSQAYQQVSKDDRVIVQREANRRNAQTLSRKAQ